MRFKVFSCNGLKKLEFLQIERLNLDDYNEEVLLKKHMAQYLDQNEGLARIVFMIKLH